MGPVEDILDSRCASGGIVTSELQSCLQLLHMEPDNKCEWESAISLGFNLTASQLVSHLSLPSLLWQGVC